MNKDTFIFYLNTVIRQVTCMSETRFKESFKEDTIKFVRMLFGEPTKTTIEIKMKIINLEENDNNI